MTLLEVLVALTISALLLSVLLGLLVAQVRLARLTAERARATDAVRTTAAVLGGEARRIAAGDVRALSADSVALRTFRGTGVACSTDAEHMVVRYRGDRLPDVTKDSAVVVRDDGSAIPVVILASRAAAGCAPREGESVLELRTSPQPRDAAVILLFESGSYYLTARALRYRLGSEGRQPLTAEAFRDASTAFTTAGPGGIRFTLTPTGFPSVHLTAAFPPQVH